MAPEKGKRRDGREMKRRWTGRTDGGRERRKDG